MFYENRSPDTAPLTRIWNVPVYGTTIVIAALVVGLVIAAFLGTGTTIALLSFTPGLFWHGEVWRGITYLIVGQLGFFTLLNLLCLYSFGSSCEQEMGRGRYFAFLGLLLLTPVVLMSILWLCGVPGFLVVSGSLHLTIGLLIAFATIYPNVEWFGGILMKYVAFGCLFIAVVGHVSERDYVGLSATLVTAAVSFGYIRAIRAGFFESFSLTEFFRRKPKLKVLPSPSARGSRREPDATEEMDALLDKIAQSGIGSLSAKERSRLEVVREELLKRDRR